MAEPKRALFLDRDGTINLDPGYISSPSAMQLLPGAAMAIRRARDHGYKIVVITNQSGVGRGLIAADDLPRINARLNDLLQEQAGASVDYFACCTHHPDSNCDCRKPLPRLVYEAQSALGLSLPESVFIGDRLTDVATGKRAPVGRTVLVRTGDGCEQEALLAAMADNSESTPDYIAEDLGGAVDWILGQK
jgi:histidinol-phosphate phosphatase family protein